MATPDWTKRTLQLLGLVFALRLILLFVVPVDLSGDEAYYWEWGRNLDWGYFSKPPLIGWLMGLAGFLFGNSEWGIRIMPLAFSTLSLLVLYALTARLFSAKAGFIAVLLLLLSPANAGASLIFTIDAPLILFWSLALYAAWNYGSSEEPVLKWAVLLMVALAAGYLSKQMMLVFPLLWAVWLGIDRESRRHFRQPLTWVIFILPLVALLPPILWNMREGWITLEHTGGHFAAKSFTMGRSLGWLGEFIGSQMGILSPVTFLLVAGCLIMGILNWKRIGRAERFLWLFAGPPLLVFLLLALRQRILPNWPAVYYVAAFSLAAGWITGGPRPGWQLGRLLKPALWTGGVIMAVAYGLLLGSPLFPLNKDIFDRIRGWSAYGEAIAERDFALWPNRESVSSERILYVVGHRYYASELAFYHPEQPQVFVYNPPGPAKSQYALWDGPQEAGADAALIVMTDPDGTLPAEVRSMWSSIEELDTINVPVTKHSKRSFRLFRASGFQSR